MRGVTGRGCLPYAPPLPADSRIEVGLCGLALD